VLASSAWLEPLASESVSAENAPVSASPTRRDRRQVTVDCDVGLDRDQAKGDRDRQDRHPPDRRVAQRALEERTEEAALNQ